MRKGILILFSIAILALAATAIWRFGFDQSKIQGKKFTVPTSTNSGTEQVSQNSVYSNKELGLSFQYDNSQKVEYYGPFKQNPRKLAQILVAEDSTDPKRQVYWTIDVWNYNVADYKVVYEIFPGFIFSSQKEISAGDFKATELSYQGMSQISGTKHVYRIYVIRKNGKTYAISGDYCNDDKNVLCEKFLETFKIQ